MNERLLQIMEYYNYSPSIFADEIGVIRSSISHIISGRNKPGVELIQKVLARFEDVSADWLLSGRGEMLKLKTSPEDIKQKFTQVNIPDIQGIRYEQLSLDDFTGDAQEKGKQPGTSANHSERERPAERISKAVSAMPPLKQNTEAPEPVPTAPPATEAAKPGSGSIKRITVYFDDNTFQDFFAS